MPDRRAIGAILLVVAVAMFFIVRTFTQPHRELVDGIVLEGSPAFIAHTREALVLIKNSSGKAYSELTKQVLTIQEFEPSGADVWGRRVQVGKKTADYSLTWYASTLVHECRHVAQYNDYLAAYPSARVPDEVYTGEHAELNCMLAQIEILERMNAPANEIEWAKKQDGHFADVNQDGRYDEKDYKKRSW